MTISLEAIGVVVSVLMGLGSFIGAIWFISSKFTHLEGRVNSMEEEMQKDEQNRKQLNEKLDEKLVSLDSRVQGVETKIAGIDVKVDSLKEGVNDLKKIMTEHLVAKPLK